MKKYINHIIQILLFTLVWCVLNESFDLIYFISGVTISWLTILFVNSFLLEGSYVLIYMINPIVMVRYIIRLIFQIYKSGINSFFKIIRGNDQVKIHTYHTKIKNEIKIGLLANAITSTPGTVTIDKEGQELKILSLGELDISSLKSFEKILKKD